MSRKERDARTNRNSPTWGYRLKPDTKEDLESLLERFDGSKQKTLDYLIKLGLEQHQLKVEQEIIDHE